MTAARIRRARPADAETVHSLVRALAGYERLEHEVTGTAEQLAEHLGGDPPLLEAFLAEDATGAPLGFALTFTTFSTFLCLPGTHIEDLFVVPQARGEGLGAALFGAVAARAAERGHGRVEWDVLDWNEPAIGFYRRLGGSPVEGWTGWRLTGEALAAAARAGIAAGDDGHAGGDPVS